MNFDTIWGDIELPGAVTKPAAEGDKSKVEPDKPKEKPEEQEEEEQEEEQEEQDQGEKEEEKSPEGSADTEKSKIPPKATYSDEDLDKTFEILDSQGVLDLDDDEEVEATPEGIAGAIASTIRKGVAKELSSAPESVKRLYEHLSKGGSEEDFEFISAPEEWAEMNEDDEDNQKLAFTQMLINQGMSVEEAEEEVEEAVLNKKLEKKSALAFKALIKAEEETKDQRAEALKNADKLAAKKAEEDIEKLKTKIKTIDNIAGFKMTPDRQSKFEDYLFKVDKKTGKTQLQLNMSDEDRKLKIAFMDFVEFNQDDITKEVETDLTKTRRRKLTRFKNKTASNTNSSKTVKTAAKSTGKIVFPSIFSGGKK